MSEPEDPVAHAAERLRGHLTVVLTAAARVAEVAASRRAQQLRDAQRQSEAAARAATNQQRAELAVTRAQLREVGSSEWWHRSSPEQVATAYATARAYGRLDPELAGTAAYLAEEIDRRYGVDADQFTTQAQASTAGSDASGEPFPAAADRTDRRPEQAAVADRQASLQQAEATALVTEADAVDILLRADGTPAPQTVYRGLPPDRLWDEPGRREKLSARLHSALPDASDAVSARTIADALQARPAATAPATAHAAQHAPKARNAPVRHAERTLGR